MHTSELRVERIPVVDAPPQSSSYQHFVISVIYGDFAFAQHDLFGHCRFPTCCQKTIVYQRPEETVRVFTSLGHIQAQRAEVFGGAAAVLRIELGLLNQGRDALLVFIVKTLLRPFGIPDVGHAHRLRAAEEDLATVDRARRAELAARRSQASVRHMAELV